MTRVVVSRHRFVPDPLRKNQCAWCGRREEVHSNTVLTGSQE